MRARRQDDPPHHGPVSGARKSSQTRNIKHVRSNIEFEVHDSVRRRVIARARQRSQAPRQVANGFANRPALIALAKPPFARCACSASPEPGESTAESSPIINDPRLHTSESSARHRNRGSPLLTTAKILQTPPVNLRFIHQSIPQGPRAQSARSPFDEFIPAHCRNAHGLARAHGGYGGQTERVQPWGQRWRAAIGSLTGSNAETLVPTGSLCLFANPTQVCARTRTSRLIPR